MFVSYPGINITSRLVGLHNRGTCVVAQLRNYATVVGGIRLALIEDGNGTRLSPIRERKRRSARMPLGSFMDLRVKEESAGVPIEMWGRCGVWHNNLYNLCFWSPEMAVAVVSPFSDKPCLSDAGRLLVA